MQPSSGHNKATSINGVLLPGAEVPDNGGPDSSALMQQLEYAVLWKDG
jgi:hypothetical protein